MLVLAPAMAQESGLPPRVTDGVQTDRQAVSTGPADETALIARARARGAVRVIVRLAVPFLPEPRLPGTGAILRQRAEIGRAQTVVLGELAGYATGGVKRLQLTPYLALEVDAAALARLAASSSVLGIQEDRPVPPTLAESTLVIGAQAAAAGGHTGAGQTVAILDTGVDKTHGFFGGRVVSEGCYSTTSAADNSSSLCPGGAPQSIAPGSGLDCGAVGGCFHGTHVAGIAAGSGSGLFGVARDASLIAIQVFSRFDDPADCNGNAPCALSYPSDQMLALERVHALRSTFTIAAVNMSLGGGQHFSNCDGDARKPAIDTLRGAGIATVISAGNNGYTSSLTAPGCISSAIPVGSTHDGSAGPVDTVSPFSNSAGFLKLLAPGQFITSAVPGGGFSGLNGTSMAAPHVTGTWAVAQRAAAKPADALMAAPGDAPAATVDEILTALTSTGVDITDPRNGITTPRIQLDAAVAALVAATDTDGDGLSDAFENQFGLNPNDATGANGAAGDPDADGLTNAQEQAMGSHPRGFFTRFFAEGATAGSLAFSTRIATANPGATAARVLYRFLETDGTTASQFVNLGMMTRHTLDVGSVAGMANAEFSTICESDQLVVSDRTMEWDTNVYASHAETSIAAAALTWNLAEGSTNGFNLFYLVQNPNATAADIIVTFLRPGGLAPLVRTFAVPATGRLNIWVNTVDPSLAATDVSATIVSTNGVTIIVERAMYLDLPGQTFGAGHESAGVTAPSLTWFFAEGATGSFFDLFVLLSNPTGTAATVRADFLLPAGPSSPRPTRSRPTAGSISGWTWRTPSWPTRRCQRRSR